MARDLGNHEDIGDDIAKFIAALDDDPPSQIWGKSQLVKLGNQVVEPLINIIINESGQIAWRAIEVLGQIGDPRSLQPLSEMLYSKNLVLGTAAVKALTQLKGVDYYPILIEALPDVHIIIQQNIILALQHSESSRVVEPLLELLQNTDSPALRYAIIQTLGIIGDRRAIPIIQSFENDEDHHVREWTEKILKQFEENEAGES